MVGEARTIGIPPYRMEARVRAREETSKMKKSLLKVLISLTRSARLAY
jgi:hypothetical protein